MVYRRYEQPRTTLMNREKTGFLGCAAKLGFCCEPIDDYCLAYELSKNGKQIVVPLLSDINPSYVKQLMMDKVLTYRLLERMGVPIPEGTYFVFDKFTCCDELNSATAVCGELKYPIVVKPNDSSRSRGLTIIERCDVELIASALKAAASISRVVIAQEFILGRELRMIAVDGEIVITLEKFPWPAKPREVPQEDLRGLCKPIELQDIVSTVMHAVGARVCSFDVIVETGRCVVLEVNTRPILQQSLEFISLGKIEEYWGRLIQILWRA